MAQTGWAPRMEFEQGLAETIRCIREFRLGSTRPSGVSILRVNYAGRMGAGDEAVKQRLEQ
jgi:hypothetical protein